MGKKYFVDIVVKKERLSNSSFVFVASCPSLGIASQGKTTEEAMKNIKEVVELYLEEQPEKEFNHFIKGYPKTTINSNNNLFKQVI